jgi:hypothetical protein
MQVLVVQPIELLGNRIPLIANLGAGAGCSAAL